MNRLVHAALLSLSLCALAPAGLSSDHVKLKQGGYVLGQAVSYDEATQTLTFEMEAGGTRSFPMSDLDGRSVYLVNRSRVPKDDAARQIRAGNLARDVGLYAHAVRHYGYAEKADPSMAAAVETERALLRSKAAAWGMENAKAAIADGDLREAEKWLVRIVEKVPGEPQAREAQAMLDRHYAKQRGERESAAREKASADLQKDLERGRRAYEGMVEKTRKGLSAERGGKAAVSAWESALKDGSKVMKELDRLDAKYSDGATVERLQEYRTLVEEQVIELHLHLASHWTVRSNYNKAMAHANKALAVAPKNQQALSARARIEEAAAERGWRW